MKQNNKTKITIAMSILLVALIILTVNTAYQQKAAPISTHAIPTASITSNSAIPSPTSPTHSPSVATISPDATAIPTATPSPTQAILEPSVGDRNAIGEITIRTDRKTKTYDIMGNVDEDTLKKNIGHLPGSALPGQAGTCILMGHRDTDFSILKYNQTGDTIMVEYNDTVYTYTVRYIEIIEADDELKFEALEGSYLVLVTCYPFRYTGRAPQKFVAVCELNKSP